MENNFVKEAIAEDISYKIETVGSSKEEQITRHIKEIMEIVDESRIEQSIDF